MGVRAGIGDLLLWWGVEPSILQKIWAFLGFKIDIMHCGMIELKVKSGLSDVQKTVRDKFIAAGGKYAVCHSVAEVRDTIMAWGIKPLAAMLKEPPPPKSVQYKMAVDFFRP